MSLQNIYKLMSMIYKLDMGIIRTNHELCKNSVLNIL